MKNILQALILFFIFSLQAQTFSVKGLVTDENKTPIYGVNILIKNTNIGTTTDFNGNFELQVSKGGILQLSYLSYQTTEITVNDSSFLTVALVPEKKQLGEVVIVSSVSKVKAGMEKTSYEVKSNTTTIGGTGLDVLRNLPSISIDAQNNISYRGTHGFIVQLNGKTLQMDAASLLSQLSANDIEKIDIITTPSAKYDNEGKTGIINVITKSNQTNFSSFQANIKGGFPTINDYGNQKTAERYGADLVYSFQKKKWDVSVGLNYNRNDMAGVRDGNVFTQNGDLQRHFPSIGERSIKNINYSGKLNVGYQIDTTQGIQFGTYLGRQSKERTADILYFNNYTLDVNNPTVQQNQFIYFNENSQVRNGDFAIVALDYEKRFQNKSKLSTSFLYEHTLLGGPTINRNIGFPDTSIVYQNERNSNTNPLDGFRYQIDYQLQPFSFGTIEVGYQYKRLVHRGDFLYERQNSQTGAFELVPEFSSEVNLFRDSHTIYTQLSKNYEKWEYNIGVRAETLNRDFELKDKANTINETLNYQFQKLFPSGALMYHFENENKLRLGYSKRVEHTTTFKMNPFPEREHSETLEQGDAELLPEFIDLAELTYSYKIKKLKMFSTVYFRNVENLINRVNSVYNDTILNRIYSNVGNAKTIGLENGFDYKQDKFSLFISTNLYRTAIKGKFNNDVIDNAAWMFGLNMNTSYRFTKTFDVLFNFNYISQRNTAQGQDSEFYLPSLVFKKTFFNNNLQAVLQWQNIDMGLLKTNEQRITTFKPNVFYTTTNYIHEVDMVILNLIYTFNSNKRKTKFVESEFGKSEF
jgi:iron complex outermembrane recepter protein